MSITAQESLKSKESSELVWREIQLQNIRHDQLNSKINAMNKTLNNLAPKISSVIDSLETLWDVRFYSRKTLEQLRIERIVEHMRGIVSKDQDYILDVYSSLAEAKKNSLIKRLYWNGKDWVLKPDWPKGYSDRHKRTQTCDIQAGQKRNQANNLCELEQELEPLPVTPPPSAEIIDAESAP